jgi:hypothetical protein
MFANAGPVMERESILPFLQEPEFGAALDFHVLHDDQTLFGIFWIERDSMYVPGFLHETHDQLYSFRRQEGLLGDRQAEGTLDALLRTFDEGFLEDGPCAGDGLFKSALDHLVIDGRMDSLRRIVLDIFYGLEVGPSRLRGIMKEEPLQDLNILGPCPFHVGQDQDGRIAGEVDEGPLSSEQTLYAKLFPDEVRERSHLIRFEKV